MLTEEISSRRLRFKETSLCPVYLLVSSPRQTAGLSAEPQSSGEPSLGCKVTFRLQAGGCPEDFPLGLSEQETSRPCLQGALKLSQGRRTWRVSWRGAHTAELGTSLASSNQRMPQGNVPPSPPVCPASCVSSSKLLSLLEPLGFCDVGL